MTLLLWTWLLSLMGAALFFAAGGVWVRRRAGADAPSVSLLDPEFELTRREVQHLSERVREASVRPKAIDAEAEAEHARLSSELAQASRKLQKLERELASSRAERAALIEQHSSEERRLEARLAGAVREHAELSAEVATLTAQQEAERAQLQSALHESEALAARVAALTAQEAADMRVQGLRNELALALETTRARDEQLEQLRKDNTRLRSLERDVARLERERTTLREELRNARARAFAGHGSLPPPARGEAGSTSAEALQSIVDRVTKAGRAKSAVIADELGLVVVTSEVSVEYGEALAAFGAYLAEVGEKTRQVLPLHDLREVIVRDDRGVVLSVIPLKHQEIGLSLVTLALHSKTEGENQPKA